MSRYKCPICSEVHYSMDLVDENTYWRCAGCKQYAYQENWIAVKEEIFTPEQGEMIEVRTNSEAEWHEREFIAKSYGKIVCWNESKNQPNPWDHARPLQPERPSYLNEGEELWEYKDNCYWGHYGSSYDYTMILNMGYKLIGYAVEDGSGDIIICNNPHWFTGPEKGLYHLRSDITPDKARILGALMLKEADK